MNSNNKERPTLLYTVYAIYFFCGMVQCFEGVFFPEFKAHFGLKFAEQGYIMFAKNIPFAIFSVAIGYLIPRLGYKYSLTVSLILFIVGTLLIIPALHQQSFLLLLVAFFLIGLGFNFEIVAGNPLLAKLGDERTSSSRLNTGNALGAVAQIIAPLVVTFVLPSKAQSIPQKLPYITNLFMASAFLLSLIAIYTLCINNDISSPAAEVPRNEKEANTSIWSQPKVTLGFISIFMVLGVEAGLFSLFRNYLEDPTIIGMDSHQSQQMFTLFFALFALGRITGAFLQKKFRASSVLITFQLMAIAFLVVIALTKGIIAVGAIAGIAFFASILFPTLYAIAIEGLGEDASKASGLLGMGFLGAAILPVVQGKIADVTSLQHSFLLGAIAYAFVLFYVFKGQYAKSFRLTNNNS